MRERSLLEMCAYRLLTLSPAEYLNGTKDRAISPPAHHSRSKMGLGGVGACERVAWSYYLVAGFLLASCGGLGPQSSSSKLDSAAALKGELSRHQQHLDEACGSPYRFPVTQKCLDLMGKFGPL